LIDLGPALGSRARARLSLLAPGVVALACHSQQPGHAGDLVVRLLRVHQLEPFRPGGFDAKKAAAFPRNSLSRSRSWTRRRSCLSSSRSWPVKGVSGLGGGSRRSRSCRTQRPSSCAPTPISSATCAIGRSVSSTSAAASRRYSGVYLFRFTIRTTLPQVSTTRELRCQHQEGKPSVVLPGAGGREADRVRTEPAIDGLSECSGDDLHRRLLNRDVSVDGRAPVVIVDHLLSRGVTFKSLTII